VIHNWAAYNVSSVHFSPTVRGADILVYVLHFGRSTGDFQPFESAALPSAPPVHATQAVPVAAPAPASSANIAASSNVDLLGDLDLSPPSMPLSMPVQPQSFTAPPAAAQSTVFDVTVPMSNTVVAPEAAVNFTTLQPNALTTSALVPGTDLTAASLESSVCILNTSSGFLASSCRLCTVFCIGRVLFCIFYALCTCCYLQ